MFWKPSDKPANRFPLALIFPEAVTWVVLTLDIVPSTLILPDVIKSDVIVKEPVISELPSLFPVDLKVSNFDDNPALET